MVSQKSVAAQLKRIGFNQHAWGRAEVRELPNIILPDEEIFECVNGIYEGGFALLVATDVRVLLIDKKPLNYLTVEDLRFDMINEIDYNHRALGAYVEISTGNRELKFRSYNQPRLRKLISHVQGCMADVKKKQVTHQEGQHQHLEQINDRLQTYLMAQYQHQQELQQRLREAQRQTGTVIESPEPPQPSPELSDYLLAQGLLAEHKIKTQLQTAARKSESSPDDPGNSDRAQDDLYAEGVREVFGSRPPVAPAPADTDTDTGTDTVAGPPAAARKPSHHGHLHPHAFTFDINPLRIAYSKLPLAMRNKKFGRPSLHAHSQAETIVQPQLT